MTTPKIEKVIYNDPATIILWDDRTKTVAKCTEDEDYDPEKGIAIAICKKMMGAGNYKQEFKKWDGSIVRFDVEIFRNLFVAVFREEGEDIIKNVVLQRKETKMTNDEKYLKEIAEQLKKLNNNLSKMTGIHTTGYRLYKKIHLMDKNCRSCRFFDGHFCYENMQSRLVDDPETPCMKWEEREDDQNDE